MNQDSPQEGTTEKKEDESWKALGPSPDSAKRYFSDLWQDT